MSTPNGNNEDDKQPLTLRDLWVMVLNHLPWRDEATMRKAREAVDTEYPPPGAETAESNRTESGVKQGDGSPWSGQNSGV
jgi:hypothetical protein